MEGVHLALFHSSVSQEALAQLKSHAESPSVKHLSIGAEVRKYCRLALHALPRDSNACRALRRWLLPAV
jgi:hypothetical protein